MRGIFFGVGWFCAVAAIAAPVASRFSAELSPTERTACGIDRLTSDEVASLDALVRQKAGSKAKAEAHLAFSQRLRPGERQAAGLERLSTAQIARLNAVVAGKSTSASEISPGFSEFGTFATDHPALVAAYPSIGVLDASDVAGPKPQIHGEITLAFGVGRGYTERSAGLELDYEDPAHGFSASLDYEVSGVRLRRPDALYPSGCFTPAYWAPPAPPALPALP